LAAAVAVLTFLPAAGALAQTQVKPGFNLFSVEQDVEIGRQSAAEAERQLPILNDRTVESYVDEITRRLAAQAPGAKFPYQAKVVNASDVNAFALPGGFLYVNRGLIDAARTEGELAGVVAHEVAHIALRHGTHNASKAYATQAGLGVLGGILGRGQSRTTQSIINAVGGLGLNAVFLKYSRDAETQADIVGAQMMARAGYDPMEMVSFFELLNSQERGRSVEFLSDHPNPANRANRVRQEAQALGAVRRASTSTGEFQDVQRRIGGLGAAPSMQQIARGQAPGARRTSRVGRVQVEAPSARYRQYRQRNDYFQMDVPDNWQGYDAENGFGVTLVPEGGVVETSNGQQAILYGVIVNHYDPFEGSVGRRNATLQQATADLVNQIRQTNTHLRSSGGARRTTIDGQPALTTVLTGTSPVTGEEERVTAVTRETGDGHVIYSLFIAPGRDYSTFARAYERMLNSLRINDAVAHGTTR
jgi:Zn-dependent protease with chaperone function